MSAIPKVVLLFSQVFGVLPIRYVKKKNSRPSIQFSRILFWINLLILTVMTIISCLALYIDFNGYLRGQPIRMKNSTNVVSVFLDVISLDFMAIVVFLSTAKKYRSFINMCCILEKIDKTLQIKIKCPTVFKFKILLLYLYATFLIFVAEVNLVVRTNGNAIMYAFPLLSYYIQTTLYVQFTFIVKNLNRRFHIISEKIKEEVESQAFNHILAKDLGLFEFRFLPERFWSADHLQLLIDSYFQLFEAVREAGAFYSDQLFVAVTCSFVHNTISLYFLMQQILSTIQGEEDKFLWQSILWVPTHIAFLVFLIGPCTTLSETAGQTPAMVCRLLNKDLSNLDVRQLLKSFLLKLLHFEVKFSAMGFFDIHSHILTSIASSVATYLVVMIQLRSDDG